MRKHQRKVRLFNLFYITIYVLREVRKVSIQF